MSTLTQAHNELFRRRPDECFSSVESLIQHCRNEHRESQDRWHLPARLQPVVVITRVLPLVLVQAGPDAQRRFVEFFVAHLRNQNTRMAYLRAAHRFFHWCDQRRLTLAEISSFHVSLYIEELMSFAATTTVKQSIAALRMLGDWLVVGQVLKTNPTSSARGPRYAIKKGKTQVLSADEARELLESIDVSTIVGLRDRALSNSLGPLKARRKPTIFAADSHAGRRRGG